MIQNSGDVFNVTAFDPDTVKRAFDTEPYQEIKVYNSIVSIKPSELKSNFIFAEKETIRAMMIIGATTSDLIMMSENDKQKIPGTPQIRRKIIEELEDRRIKTFASIVEERNKLVNELKTNNNKLKSNPIPSSTKITKSLGYEKLKQKHLNSLISYQDRKNKLQKSEEAATIRLNELKKTKIMEMQKRKQEEQKKMKSHLLNLINKSNELNLNADKNENERITKEEEIEKVNNEIKVLEESLTKLPKKLQKEKKAQIETLKNKISEEANINDTHEKTKKEDKNLLYDKFDVSNISNTKMQFNKKEEMKHFILKEKEQILYKQKEKLAKQLYEKDAKIEANLKLISSQKMKHLRENRIILRKRSQSAAATKKLLEQQRLEKFQKSLQRQEEALARAKALKASKTNNLLERAGENWIKQKNGVDKAKKMSIQKRYKAIEKAEKTIEKQNEIKSIKEQDEIKKIKEYRTMTIKKVKQKEEYDDLKKEIILDPDADPIKLANKYKIDIDAVQKMQIDINNVDITHKSKK